MSAPRVTVAVTQRESFGHTRRSLESLYATAGEPFDLVYVDAGSPPAVQRFLRDEAQRRGFQIIRRESFLTPNQTRNLALAAIDTEFVAFVDNDVLFRDGWLRNLLACADETGAELTGPLLFMQEPPYRRIHFAGGEMHVEETASGRRIVENHRFLGHNITAEIRRQIVRGPSGFLELHCLLARRSIFERIGPFDEGLRSMNEHVDLCLLVRQSGGLVMFEPSAVANHLLPQQLPFDLQSLRFFFTRWSRSNNRASADHFRTKWNLNRDDPATEATYNWSNDRQFVIVRWLQPKLVTHGVRKVTRMCKRLSRQVAKRAAAGS